MAQANWLGYEFNVYDHAGSWTATSGLYIFAGREKDSQGTLRWRALYVGETQDFSTRLPTHEYWMAAVRLGATHVHARTEVNAERRVAIEGKLIQTFQPPLNVQGK